MTGPQEAGAVSGTPSNSSSTSMPSSVTGPASSYCIAICWDITFPAACLARLHADSICYSRHNWSGLSTKYHVSVPTCA